VLTKTAPSERQKGENLDFTITGQTVECNLLGDLGGGASAQITVHTTVNARASTTVTNTAVVEASESIPEIDTTDNTESATVSVGELPHTGFDLFRFATFGTLLLLAGLVLIAATRRREDEEPQA